MHCTYITKHTSGLYYIGKSQPHLVDKGYQGSGVRLHCAFHWPGYEKETWTTTVQQVFLTEAEAYEHEAELCPLERLADPFCMNDTPGGRKMMRGSAHGRLLKKLRPAKRRKANTKKRSKA